MLNNKPGTSAAAREAVLKAINSGGYRARNGAGRTPQIALIHATPNLTALRGYDADIASGVYAGVAEQHAQFSITDLTQKAADENYTQFFIRNNIDGVVLRVTQSSRHVARNIAEESFPCVVVSDRFDGEPVSYVDYDSRTGMARAMDYLFELGHRRIGFAMNSLGNDTDHQDRHEAYCEGLARHEIQYEPSLVITTVSSIQGGASVIDQFMAMANPPTAIIFTNPPPTIGGIRRALQRGLSIPGDLSIVGYDNGALRQSVFPAFSAVYQDAEHIGRAAATALVERMQNRTLPPAQVVIPTLFEVNETTGEPRPRVLKAPAAAVARL